MNTKFYQLISSNFFKWIETKNCLAIIINEGLELPELEGISHIELSHKQAWVLSLLDGQTGSSTLAKSFAKSFGSPVDVWEVHLNIFFKNLERYQIINKVASPEDTAFLEIPQVLSMNPQELSSEFNLVKGLEVVVELYAGTIPTPT